MEKLSLLIADDHWIARSAAGALFKKLADHVEILEASSTEEAVGVSNEQNDIDLIVLDLKMPGNDPLASISEFKRNHPNAPVIVMSASEDRVDVLRSLENGAVGYIPKTSSPNTILAIAKGVLDGQVSMPQQLLSNNLKERSAFPSTQSSEATVVSIIDNLTPRQKQVFELLGEGANNLEIANILSLSVNTVRVHLQAISNQFKAIKRSQLVSYATEWKNQRSLGLTSHL
ncbi:MAG: response regulator transcription factor [Pseudomonadota bacterium]